MHFQYTLMDSWPALAWLAKCSASQSTIEILHGSQLETHEQWFCEAIWDGDYQSGDFDRTDIIFGSGGRLRTHDIPGNASATFVSSCTAVDRLHSHQNENGVWISNSLACLSANIDGRVDPTYSKYFEDLYSIAYGLEQYKRSLSTSAGPIRLTYFHNLQWDGQELRESEKPYPIRDFSSFGNYRHFLQKSLQLINDNLSCYARKHSYRMLGTLSSGYDSPTITVLARDCGVEEAISFVQARNGQNDSGQEIANILNIRILPTSRDEWRNFSLPEVPFLTADAHGEDVYFYGTQEVLKGRVLLTGHNGDSVWGIDNDKIATDLRRTTPSGLSLSEYRLSAGFIHCTVPFIGMRQCKEINEISRSAEMKPWDTGTDYNRPICRRIVEEAGVPRDKFATHKSANSVLFYERNGFLTPASLADYRRWIKDCSKEGHIHPCASPTFSQIICSIIARILTGIANIAPGKLQRLRTIAYRFTRIERQELFRYVFPWALERAKEAYRAQEHLSIK